MNELSKTKIKYSFKLLTTFNFFILKIKSQAHSFFLYDVHIWFSKHSKLNITRNNIDRS